MQKSTGTRIDLLLDALNISQLDFAKRMNISSAAITNWKKRQLGINVINKIVECFPQISRDWLITGEGSCFKASQVVTDLFSATEDEEYNKKLHVAQKLVFKSQDTEEKRIPLIPVDAMDGALSDDNISINKWDIEDWLVIPALRKSDFAIRVEGDSMQPRYFRGDIITCTRVPLNSLWFQWGKVYVVSTRQGALVKHVEKGSDLEHILLVSDNPDYKPFEIPTSELFGVAIVNGLIRVE